MIMLTKEEYIKKKEGEFLDVEIVYQYWLDKKLPEYRDFEDIQEFIPLFKQYIETYRGIPILNPQGETKILDVKVMIEKMYKYFDEKFFIFK